MLAIEYELLLFLYLIQCLTLMINLNMLKNGHFMIFYADEFIKIWDIITWSEALNVFVAHLEKNF